MEFDSELSQIQGALMKANNLHNFMDLKYRAGNTKEIKSVVAVLLKVLSDKGYVTEDGIYQRQHAKILRKITFFLILNSDITLLSGMVDNDEIGHIIWVTPLISKCVLISLITELDLISFYCELIEYGHPPLATELLELATQNINYTTPQQKIEFINLLITSSYSMVSRLVEYPLEENVCKNICSVVYEKLNELLKSFNEPPKKRTDVKQTTTKLEDCGRAQLKMLQMLINSLNIFLKKSTRDDGCCEFEIYFMTHSKNESAPKNEGVIEGYLLKFNELLFEYTKLSIMKINVDMFCDWFDYEEYEGSDKSLQRAVGEQAYQLQELLKNNPQLENEIATMLDAISMKPLGLEDIIKDADRNTILINSNYVNNPNQYEWLTSMMKRDSFFQDNDFMDCVIQHVAILKESDCKFIVKEAINLLFSVIKNEYPDMLKMLIITALSKLSHEDQVGIVIVSFTEHEISNVLELPNHDKQMTEFFNKLIDIDDTGKNFELIKMFIQNPNAFYKKIFNECVKNSKQTRVMLKAVAKLTVFDSIKINRNFDVNKYKNVSLSNMSLLILNTLNEINTKVFETELQSSAYIVLMKGLIDYKILNNDVLLLRITLPKLQSHLTDKDLKGLLLQLKVLEETFCPDSHSKYMAPLLVVLSQVIELIRWDLKSFTATAVEVIESAIRLQNVIMAAFTDRKTPADNEFKWISTKLSNLSPMTSYYYRKLWPNTPFKGFFDKSTETSNLQISLCYLLPRCTLEEFKEICTNLLDGDDPKTGFKTLCDILALIGSASEELKSDNSFNCLENCCRNLACVLQDLIKSNNYTTAEPLLVESVVDLLNCLPEHLQNRCFTCFMCAIAECCTSSEKSSENMDSVKQSLEKIKDNNSKTVMFQLLSNKSE